MSNREWRCNWNLPDRWCSNYIRVISRWCDRFRVVPSALPSAWCVAPISGNFIMKDLPKSFMIKLPEIGATQHKDGSADGTTRNQAHQREDIWTKGLRFTHCTHVTHCPQLTPGKWNDEGRHGPETTSFKMVGAHIAPHACHAPLLKSVLSCCPILDTQV